jgi:hypothetical protein
MKNTLRILSTSVLLTASASAAAITWDSATTITGDTDVSTDGTAIAAYTAGYHAALVNGVNFTQGTGITFSNGTDIVVSGLATAYSGYSAAAAPYSNLSSAYKSLLSPGNYNGSGTFTVTFNDLTDGDDYQVQFWISDPRIYAVDRTATIVNDVNSSSEITVDYNSTDAVGGVGQYVIGTFTADATESQTFSITGANQQLNAAQCAQSPSQAHMR